MKKLLKKLLAWLKGEAKKKVPVVLPEKKPDTGCDCDLSLPIATPPYTADYLHKRGNLEECPKYHGKDIRLAVILPNGKFWCIGSLLPKGIASIDGNTIVAQCIQVPEGRYHFLGTTYGYDDNPKHIQLIKPGVPFQHKGTTFTWYQFRG